MEKYSVPEEDWPILLAKDLKRYSEPFVAYYWSFVGRLACQLARSNEDAEDLRQEVFICVLRALERKSTEEIEGMKFREYFHVATRHCHINKFLRGKRRLQFVESLDTPAGMILREMLVDENVRDRQPEMAFEYNELICKVRELLNSLPLQQSVAVMLRHGWGLGYPAIAQALQISEERAKYLVRCGKKKLKEIVSVQADDDHSCLK